MDPDPFVNFDVDLDLPFNFDANLDPPFHFVADPDPAPHQSDANLRPLVYRTLKAPFGTSTALQISIVGLRPFTFMRVRNQLPTMIRIHADPATQHWFNEDDLI